MGSYLFPPFVLTSAKRRYHDFKRNKFNMLMFESKKWGWENYPVDETTVFLKGGDVYIALAGSGRDESYFSNFHNKIMVGILGYHYAFANFNNDEKFLRENFSMQLTPSHEGSIQMVLAKRGDIAVVTKSFFVMEPSVGEKTTYFKENGPAVSSCYVG